MIFARPGAAIHGRGQRRPRLHIRTASSTPAATARALSEIRAGSTDAPRGSMSPTLAPASMVTPPTEDPAHEAGDGRRHRGIADVSHDGAGGHHRADVARGLEAARARRAQDARLGVAEHRRRRRPCRAPPSPSRGRGPGPARAASPPPRATSSPAMKPGPRPITKARAGRARCRGCAWPCARPPARPDSAARRGAPSGSTTTATKRRGLVAQAAAAADPPARHALDARPRRRRPPPRTPPGGGRPAAARAPAPPRGSRRGSSRRAAAEASSPPPRTHQRGARPRSASALPSGLEPAGQLHLHGADGRRDRRRGGRRSSRPGC